MKKALSVILCITMLITALPVSLTVGAEAENPICEVSITPGEITLFLDEYYPEESAVLTAEMKGEAEEKAITDVDTTEWSSRSPSVASVEEDSENKLSATVKPVAEGTANIVFEARDKDGATLKQAICKVTVRKSIKTHYDNFAVTMGKIPDDVDASPAKYSKLALAQLESAFGEIQDTFDSTAEYEGYCEWRTAILKNTLAMQDTADNCRLIDNWEEAVFNVVYALRNSVLASDSDTEFWAKWKEAYALMPADLSAYTEKSAKTVTDIISEKEKTEWLKNDAEKINSLAADLKEAIENLKVHTTDFRFLKDKKVVNYGTGSFKIEYYTDGYDDIEWWSSDENIATVNDAGQVILLGAIPENYGKKVRISAISNSITASCELDIRNPISSIEIHNITVFMGTTRELIVDIHAADDSCPTTETPEFVYSSDETIVKIDEKGIITPVSAGNCKISVALKNDSETRSEAYITVVPSKNVTRLTGAGLPTQVTVNDTAKAKLFVYPPDATNKEVKWTSSDEKIAKVTSLGTDDSSYATANITGISSGSCTIYYEAADGSGVKGSFSVTVNPLVEFIEFNKTNITTYIGSKEEIRIEAKCQPINAGNQKLTWISDDENVATVKDGKITLVATGSCTITAMAQDGSGTKKSTGLIVLGSAKTMTMSEVPSKMNVGEKIDIDCEVLTEQNVKYEVRDWSVSDGKIAKISNSGLLEALYPGKVTVTAKYFDGETRTKTVTVVAALEGVSLPSALTLAIGKTKTLVPEFTPEYATNKNVVWTTSDSSVASVTKTGEITAAGVGTAIITVKSEEGEYISTCRVLVIRPVTGVTLNKDSYTLTMGKTESFKLYASVSPEDATTKDVSFKSSNKKVAEVSSTGVVTAKGPGVATITATTSDGGFTATCKVTVKQPLKSIKFSSSKATYYVGQKKALTLVFTPSNASNKGVTYKTSDSKIASVKSSGVVTAKKKGTCTVTAVSDDGSYKASCTVTVKSKVNVQDVDIIKSSVTIDAGKTKQLTFSIYPSNASVQTVKWSSSDKSIASVNSSGVVTAHKGGTVTIKCTSNDTGVYDKCKVSVYEKVKSVSLSATSLTLVAGKTKMLTAAVSPSTATNKSIKWYSTNTNVAAVSSSGKVTALKGGTCEIVAKSKDNTSVKARCKLTVLQPPTKITLSETELEIVKGDKSILTAKVSPSDSYNKNVVWSSNKTTVAKVSSTGVVTAVSAGTCQITCKSEADANVKRVCNVTVYQPVTGVSVSPEKVTLTTGRTKMLSVTVSPSKASNKKVTFKTSDKTVVKVSSKGVIEAVGPGQATVTVCTKDGFYTAKTKVTVIEPVVSISLNKKSTTITVGKTKTLIATVRPTNATNKDVIWRSSNPLVARVTQSGVVTALKEGKATITCKTDDGGFSASCKVTCIIPVSALSLSATAATIKKGSSKTIKAYIYPSDATNTDVTWTTSDKTVATVDQSGKIKAVNKGVCIITCTTKQGSKKATCIVTVK